jgi:hypothetical protein
MGSLAEAMNMGLALADRVSQTRERRRNEMLSNLVGMAVAKGDYQGGAASLMRGGNIEGGIELQGVGQQQQQLDDARRQQLGSYAFQTLQQLRSMPIAQRAQIAPQMAARLSEFGIDVSQVDYGDLSDATLDGELAMLAPFAPAPADPIPVPAGNTLYQPGRNGEPGQPIFSAPFKPEEALAAPTYDVWVSGTKRKITRGRDGTLYDTITGQPVDQSQVSWTEPAAEGGGLDQFGAEARARVALEGQNVGDAANRMTQMYGVDNQFRDQRGVVEGAMGRRGPYGPSSDIGARALGALPGFGIGLDAAIFDPVAKWVGGSDYREATQAWDQFENGVMSIKAGTAVSDSEARRVLRALQPGPGDDENTVSRKIAAVNNIASVLNSATGGDPLLYERILQEAAAAGGTTLNGGGAGGAPQNAGGGSPSNDPLGLR